MWQSGCWEVVEPDLEVGAGQGAQWNFPHLQAVILSKTASWSLDTSFLCPESLQDFSTSPKPRCSERDHGEY